MPLAHHAQFAAAATDLLFESMTASAGLSSLGETQLDLLSAKADLKPEDLLGKPITVTVQLRDDAQALLQRLRHALRRRPAPAAATSRYQATVQPVALVPDAHRRTAASSRT